MTDSLDRLTSALADRYSIERELGSGGMATVYLAEDFKHKRKVALKVLRPELASSIGAERFLREIEIAARLNHLHILPLLDSGGAAEVQGGSGQVVLYYTMPYVEGKSLRDRLNREKQLPIDDAIQITKEVADALGYAHSLGIVHRDIKPENILFTARHAVVSDFGIARAVTEAGGERLTETGIAVGTPEYMSPEQASGEKDIDARSDLYSLGCVLYEMLSGDAPYTGPTPQALIAKKMGEPTPRISVVRETVPAGIEAAVLKALEKNPADRFSTAQQFVEVLTTPSDSTIPVEQDAVAAAEGGGSSKMLRWLAAMVTVVAIAAVVVLLRGEMPGLEAAPEEEIDRLVVAPLENRTGDSAAADWGFLAAEYITRAIDRASVVTVVPASGVRDLVRDVDPALGMSVEEIARRTWARYALAGSFSTSAGIIRFNVELVDAESGELLQSLEPVVGPVDSPEAVISLLSERVAAAVTAILNPGLQPGWSLWSSPLSMEAVGHMLATQDLFCRTRYRAAIEQAQSALEQTPGFAPLLLLASMGLANIGQVREADSVLALIEPLRGQLSTAERRLEEWVHGALYGDHAEMTRAAEELYRIHPSGYGYHAGLTAVRTNRFAEALERFLVTDRETPCYRIWSPLWQYTAQSYHALGLYRDELAVARDGLGRFPNHRPLLYHEAIALAGMGRLDAVDSLLDLVADLPPQSLSGYAYNPGSQTAFVALELEVLGHLEASAVALERSLAWFAAQPTNELRFQRGQAFYWAERWSDADTLFAALIQDAPANVEQRGHWAVTLAHLGRRDEALEIDRWLEQLERPYLLGQNTRWRAAIAAALGDREAAVQLLRQAYDEGMTLGHAFHRGPEWRPLRDYRPYQEFVRAR